MGLKIGIVGLGRLGWLHASHLSQTIPDATLKCICSIDQQELKRFKEEINSRVETFTDFQKMVETEPLDGVVIASSSTAHCEQAEVALKRGLHTFIEKPIGVTLSQVDHIKQVASNYPNQLLMVGFMRRFDPSYRAAKEIIDSGKIGKPFLVRCYGLDPVDAIEGAIAFSEKSGGLFIDMAIHDIDLARWFLNAEPKQVYATGGCYAFKEFSRYNDIDNGAALMKFRDNSMALFYAGRTCAHGYHIETEIVGTEGALRVGAVPEKNLVTLFLNDGVKRTCSSHFSERFKEAYREELVQFLKAIKEGLPSPVGIEEGIVATKAAYACRDSYTNDDLIKIEW